MPGKLSPESVKAIADRAEAAADPTARKLPAHLRDDLKFQPGQSGNPAGRPKGARSKLGEAFLEAMSADFDAHGKEAIEKVRSDKPEQYLKVIAMILPKDLNVNINPMDTLTDDELIERIRALDATIRPFLDAQGTDGVGSGAGAETTH